MSATFTEVLPETKSSKHSALQFTPDPDRAGCGRLVIDTARARVAYAVAEFRTPWDGRAFHLEKLTAGTDRASDAEDVFVCRNGQDRRCSCRGFEFTGHCKHLAAVLALIGNGWV